MKRRLGDGEPQDLGSQVAAISERNAKEPDEQKINWLELELEFLLARGGPVIRGAR
jgi:hypothetical protein